MLPTNVIRIESPRQKRAARVLITNYLSTRAYSLAYIAAAVQATASFIDTGETTFTAVRLAIIKARISQAGTATTSAAQETL